MRFAFAKSSRRYLPAGRQVHEPKGERSGKSKLAQPVKSTAPVSLIVCSKNEAENLRTNIPKWLDQEHDSFQLVLINDASIDETKEVIESFAAKDPRITVVNVENNEAFWGSKKYALTLGIKRAAHKILIFTDADCVPASKQWLQHMANAFVEQKELVLGYGAYKKIKGSFLNSLIRFETVFTAMQYFGYAKWGNAYMGVGRNLAYTSDLFYEESGFMNHMKVQSGDDDLFVNGASTPKNTALCSIPDSYTISLPKTSFKAWRTQKRRHVHVAKHYKNKHKALLGLFYVSQIAFIMLAITLLILQWQWPIIGAIIGVRYLINWIVVGKLAFKLNEKDLAFFYPLYEVLLIIFQLSIFSSNLIAKPRRWK